MSKQVYFLLLVLSLFCKISYSQDLSISDSILNELKTVVIKNYGRELRVKVHFPNLYDSSKVYPVFLGFSGGNQTEEIVNYCYAAWFRNKSFKNHLIILPINDGKASLAKKTNEELEEMIEQIKNHFKLTSKKWILSATSNGGVTAFHLLSIHPEMFTKVFVIPGYADDRTEITKKWKHLKFVIAYGENDEKEWKDKSFETEKKLKLHCKKTILFEMKGQGHILDLNYDIENIYKAL